MSQSLKKCVSKQKPLFGVSAFWVSILCLAGCDIDPIQPSALNSTLVYCSEGSPDSFDPHTTTIGTSFDASARQLYNRLVAFKPGTIDIAPSIAKSWSISEDGRTYRFHLRADISFHEIPTYQPSRFLNAEDVLFSFERQRNIEHPYHFVGKRAYSYFDFQGLGKLIDAINIIDSYTIEFKLNQPYSPFLSVLAMEFASIMSAEYADHLTKLNQQENFITQPVGTGPYKFVRYQPDAYIRYRAHPTYWAGKQQIENLVFAITSDSALRFARVSAGECDVMSSPLPIQLKAVTELNSQQKHLKVLSQRGLNIAYWTFNTKIEPFNNPLVRKALNFAINREAIMKAVYYNTAEIAKNPIPPDMWSYNHKIPNTDYNPLLARNLLYQAGFPNGFTTNIWAFPEQRTYNPNSLKTAELIQQDLKAIGVTAKIISYEFGTFNQKVKFGEHQTALQGWIADNGDPDNFFGSLLSCDATRSGQNSAFWCNHEFDALIQDARHIAEQSKRTQLYESAQQIFHREHPWAPIAHTKQHFITNERVKNLKLSPSGGIFFEGVTLDQLNVNEDQTAIPSQKESTNKLERSQ